MIKLDILSDPICPWCYIAKTLLDRALEAHPDHPFHIEWHPFQLNPDMPAAGMDRRDYLERVFGSQQETIKAYSEIVETAEKAGLKLDLAAIKRTPSTLGAHRVIHWAGLEGRQSAAVSALFRAYFCEGRDIGAPAVLNEIACTIGMETAMVERLLASDADKDIIRERDANAREKGVGAVPMFIVGNHYALSGAQQTELWSRVIREVQTAHAQEDQADAPI